MANSNASGDSVDNHSSHDIVGSLVPKAPSGNTVELVQGSNIIGRGRVLGIFDARVSRRHMRLDVHPDGTSTVTAVSSPVHAHMHLLESNTLQCHCC